MRIKLTLLLCLTIFASPGWAAPASQYWSIWDKSDSQSTQVIDHSSWSRLLSKYIRPQIEGSVFDYARVSRQDRQRLSLYIDSLTSLDPRAYNRREQKAYWINLYNALTVQLVLRHYPVKSITRIGPWYKFGPWDETITEVAGQALTLNDIEHRILRPVWQDKRIHYAVNCASMGCPDLAGKAYTGASVNEMLDVAAKRFINQEKGVVFIDGMLTLSRIYEWYSEDFGSQEALLGHIKSYSTPRMIRRIGNYKGVLHYQYNWSLNQAR